MKNFADDYLKLDEEQKKYVQNIKDLIYRLLEAKGSPQHMGNYVHGTFDIIPYAPRHGKVFDCETNGTGFSFSVRVRGGFIEAFGTVPGPAPVKMITKKWRSLKRLEKEFIQIFGECFYKSLSLTEMFANKKRVNIAA